MVGARNPAPVDKWFIPVFSIIYRLSTILLVVQDFATIHSIITLFGMEEHPSG